MSIEGLILSLIIALVTVAVIASPLLQRSAGSTAEDVLIEKQRERLLVYYERVLTNLRDLDEDFRTGKMQTADYETEREEAVQRGVQVLKALDEVGHHHLIVSSGDQAALDHAIDDAIERAIAAHRKAAH